MATDTLAEIHSATNPSFHESVVASEFFTKGSCHQLAVALVSVLDNASVVAIYDHADEDGNEADQPRLVHAAAMVGDRILDIEDFVDREVWIERWADQARDPNFIEYDLRELTFEYTSPAHMRFSEEIAARLVDFWGAELNSTPDSWASDPVPPIATRA